MVATNLVEACRSCVEAFAADDDEDALVTAADLLRHPVQDTIRWLGGAVLMLAQDVGPAELERLSSRRLPDPGVVHRTIITLRDDPAALRDEAQEDARELVLRLAATAAALLEHG